MNVYASVIICTRNRKNDLMVCLDSLARQTERSFELIIVDSSDVPLQHDNTFNQKIQKIGLSVIYVHTEPGLTLQRNKGIDLACGNILYFFDDDVQLEPDYLAVMRKTFKRFPQYVGGMGSIINMQQPMPLLWRLFHQCFFLQRDYASGHFTLSGMPTHAYGNQTMMSVKVLGGCCMAFKKEVLQKHCFDEKLKRYAYMEDADISWRISQEGLFFYQPLASLYHYASPVARDTAVENRAMFMRNYRYLFFKNVYPKNRLRIIAYWWTIIGLYLKALLLRDSASLRGYRILFFDVILS